MTTTPQKNQKQLLQEAHELLTKHKGRTIITAWAGHGSWVFTGLGKGVQGDVIGWGIDGPQIEVCEAHEQYAPVKKFYPGARGGNWGEGETWNFKGETKVE